MNATEGCGRSLRDRAFTQETHSSKDIEVEGQREWVEYQLSSASGGGGDMFYQLFVIDCEEIVEEKGQLMG